MTAFPTASLKAPAWEVLVACSRARHDSTSLSRVAALATAAVDWSSVAELAATHGTRPMLYRAVTAACPRRVPPTVMEKLQEECVSSATRNLCLTSELLALLESFEEHGVPAIPMKGPVLAEIAYGSLALREFHDVDILVRKKDIPRAVEVLHAQGYTEIDTSAHGDAYSRVFSCDAAGTLVDLHWGFAGPRFHFGLEPERLFERCVTAEVSGRKVASLSPEDMLLLLCMHGAKHCWSRLAWICDIAEIVCMQQAMDWRELVARAEQSGSARMLVLGLAVASDVFGVVLPPEMERRASHGDVVRLVRTVRRWLLEGKDGAAHPIERESFYVAMRERPLDRAKHFLHGLVLFVVPNARDDKALRLPRALSWLHWLVRPLRLVLTYGNPAALLKRLV